MRFENAMVALRQGYKVCRQKNVNRLNGIYYKMKDGHIDSYSIIGNYKGDCIGFSLNSIEADDWMVYKETKREGK